MKVQESSYSESRYSKLIDAQKRALEMALHGESLSRIFDDLLRAIERSSDEELFASVLLLSTDGFTVTHCSAPSLPISYSAALNGSPIGPNAGSCGTAAFLARPVITEDIDTDPRWAGYRDLAASHGLKACWSTPILTAEGRVLGTFAMYYKRCQLPVASDTQLIHWITQTAALLISNHSQRIQIEDNNLRLRNADRAKDEFLALLAHELRNPLAAIQNALAVLHGLSIRNEHLEYTESIMRRQLRQLTRLVDDLLDLSRVTKGKIQLQSMIVDISSVVQQALECVRPLIDERQHTISVVVPETPPLVTGDPVRLTQVLTNLLNNAVKYTEPGGSIKISVEPSGSEVAIAIKDNGIGIAPELLPRIFEWFVQAERSLDRSQGGLGIGLTLVRDLVRLHDGEVEARSAGIGNGSEFIVRLPAAKESSPAQRESTAEMTSAVSPHLRILVVDDNVDSAACLALLLRFSEHEVHIAHDGLSAIELARSILPQIVLLDIGLPKMNGYEVAAQLRSETDLAPLVLIALTGYGREEDRVRSVQAGFDHHLVKPYEIETLEKLLAACVHGASYNPAPAA